MNNDQGTPPTNISPSRRSQYVDRHIPNTSSIAHILMSPSKATRTSTNKPNQNEVLGIQKLKETDISPIKISTKSLFSFKSPVKSKKLFPTTPLSKKYQEFNVSDQTRKLLTSPKRSQKVISKTPFKVLDAPELQDDFYLNLVHWGSQNILCVGLGPCVYLWNATTSDVTKMCDLGENTVTSLSWSLKGNILAVGTHSFYVVSNPNFKKGTNQGEIQLWDVNKMKKQRTIQPHNERIGTSAWSSETFLSSGSRDRQIIHHDLRSPRSHSFKKQQVHTQEVCGLKYNLSSSFLASGGNDNKLLVWDIRSDQPVHTFTDHQAAVKAIAWSPVQSNLLASGGGTADQKIRFWNTGLASNMLLRTVDTGSQVCNIAWENTGKQLVSTHGYSQNQISVWGYKEMDIVATLTGHTSRVLYLAMSPEGQNIVTGAGDETLRFWNVFDKINSSKREVSFSHQMR